MQSIDGRLMVTAEVAENKQNARTTEIYYNKLYCSSHFSPPSPLRLVYCLYFLFVCWAPKGMAFEIGIYHRFYPGQSLENRAAHPNPEKFTAPSPAVWITTSNVNNALKYRLKGNIKDL